MSMNLCTVIERQLTSSLIICSIVLTRINTYPAQGMSVSQARLLNLKHSMILMADDEKLLSFTSSSGAWSSLKKD